MYPAKMSPKAGPKEWDVTINENKNPLSVLGHQLAIRIDVHVPGIPYSRINAQGQPHSTAFKTLCWEVYDLHVQRRMIHDKIHTLTNYKECFVTCMQARKQTCDATVQYGGNGDVR